MPRNYSGVLVGHAKKHIRGSSNRFEVQMIEFKCSGTLSGSV